MINRFAKGMLMGAVIGMVAGIALSPLADIKTKRRLMNKGRKIAHILNEIIE